MDAQKFSNLIAFWRAVEALSPQNLPRPAPLDRDEPTRNWSEGVLPPWSDPVFKKREIRPSQVWRHGVYGGVYELPRFIRLLEQTVGVAPDVFEQRSNGQSSVLHVAVDELGQVLPASLMISMAAWAFGVIQTVGIKGLDDPEACDLADSRRKIQRFGEPALHVGAADQRQREPLRRGGVETAHRQTAQHAQPSAPQKLARSPAGTALFQACACAWPCTRHVVAQPHCAAIAADASGAVLRHAP